MYGYKKYSAGILVSNAGRTVMMWAGVGTRHQEEVRTRLRLTMGPGAITTVVKSTEKIEGRYNAMCVSMEYDGGPSWAMGNVFLLR